MAEYHALYSPSKLARILECPGSVRLTQEIEEKQGIEKSSIYALEGTKKHNQIAFLLEHPKEKLDGYSDDVIEAIDYAKMLRLKYADDSYEEYIETIVSLEPDVYNCYGTLDYAIVTDKSITIVDWKMGHTYVSAKDNSQLKAYMVGLLNHLAIHDPAVKLYMTIVQPNINNIETEQTTVKELQEWLTFVKHRLSLVNRVEPVYSPSERACKWCRAAVICKANKQYNNEIARKAFEAYTKITDNEIVKPEELAEIVNKAKAFNNYINAIKTYAYNKLMRGSFPGFKLVKGRTTRSWINEEETRNYIEEVYDYDEHFVSKMKTPAQYEKELRVLKKDSTYKDLIKSFNKPVVALESDRRKAIEPLNDIFKD